MLPPRMKTILFLIVICGTAFADGDWRALSPYGPLAEIHTANVPQPNGKWLHTAKITPLVMDLGIRIWCNGSSVGTYLVTNPVTAQSIDGQRSARWDWDFSTDFYAHIPFWMQNKADQ